MTRERGHYGSFDRERHWAAGWAADRVQDRVVGAVARPVLPVVGDAFRAQRGARRWGEASTKIGQELFHTVADRERAILQLETGFHALANDLAVWQLANSHRPDASTFVQWLAADVTPALEEFATFAEYERRSWWRRAATSWETLETWWDRLKQLRSLARAHGVALQSVEPTPLPQTIWQKGAEGKGSEATAVLGVLKIGVLAVLGIMGAAGAYSAIKSLKSRAQTVEDRAALRAIVREELRK